MLTHFNGFYLGKVEKNLGYNSMSDFSKDIVSYRNTLSHSTISMDNKKYETVAKLSNSLKFLIRDWMLRKIGINSKILDLEYKSKTPITGFQVDL